MAIGRWVSNDILIVDFSQAKSLARQVLGQSHARSIATLTHQQNDQSRTTTTIAIGMADGAVHCFAWDLSALRPIRCFHVGATHVRLCPFRLSSSPSVERLYAHSDRDAVLFYSNGSDASTTSPSAKSTLRAVRVHSSTPVSMSMCPATISSMVDSFIWLSENDSMMIGSLDAEEKLRFRSRPLDANGDPLFISLHTASRSIVLITQDRTQGLHWLRLFDMETLSESWRGPLDRLNDPTALVCANVILENDAAQQKATREVVLLCSYVDDSTTGVPSDLSCTTVLSAFAVQTSPSPMLTLLDSELIPLGLISSLASLPNNLLLAACETDVIVLRTVLSFREDGTAKLSSRLVHKRTSPSGGRVQSISVQGWTIIALDFGMSATVYRFNPNTSHLEVIAIENGNRCARSLSPWGDNLCVVADHDRHITVFRHPNDPPPQQPPSSSTTATVVEEECMEDLEDSRPRYWVSSQGKDSRSRDTTSVSNLHTLMPLARTTGHSVIAILQASLGLASLPMGGHTTSHPNHVPVKHDAILLGTVDGAVVAICKLQVTPSGYRKLLDDQRTVILRSRSSQVDVRTWDVDGTNDDERDDCSAIIVDGDTIDYPIHRLSLQTDAPS